MYWTPRASRAHCLLPIPLTPLFMSLFFFPGWFPFPPFFSMGNRSSGWSPFPHLGTCRNWTTSGAGFRLHPCVLGGFVRPSCTTNLFYHPHWFFSPPPRGCGLFFLVAFFFFSSFARWQVLFHSPPNLESWASSSPPRSNELIRPFTNV